MFKIGRKTDTPQDGAQSSETEGKGSWFKENQRSIVAVGLIVIMAFVMRFIFSFGVSAGSDFALSGGLLASEHLHTITQILNGGSFFGVDDTLSYPFGSVNSNPVLIDAILAGIAMIGTALGMSAVKAASLTLATFSLVCGTAAVIPMFLLGKEVIGTRKAGFVAAIFLAFCPIVITQTVFSNGTETGWILLLFIVLSLMMIKGLKAINTSTKTSDPFKEVFAANKSAVKLAAISGLVLALIVLSTNDFRAIVFLMIFAMAIMTVVGRFMYRDTRQVVLFFSIIIAIGMAVAAAYYIPAKLWDQVLSGILILSALTIVLCFTFSLLQRKPWVVTVPVYLIGIIVAFVLLSSFAPEFYDVIVNGNTPLAACVEALADRSLSVSFVSTAFGVVAMWASIFVIGVLIWKLPKNLSSIRYQFLVIFMVFSALMASQSEELATVFSPVFALGFAYVIMWFFDHVDFKTYFMSIKNAGFRHAWRKILKPIPFGSILIIAVLLCVPLGMYAIDAGISNNDSDDYKGLQTGAIGYYVKTDSDWRTGSVLSSYSDVNKDGALVTWLDYANDAATMGKFKVIVDGEGNGAEAVSNILLSDAVDGSSDAAMMIYLLTYTGMTDEIKSKLVTADLMTEDDYNAFKDIMDNPSKYRSDIINDTAKYGVLESNVSDDNVRYIYGSEFLTEKYSAYKIANMYSAVAEKAGSISYFMVDGTMFPMYYGYSSLFSTMAYANGYVISDAYGTVPEFLVLGYITQYTGLYEYTDAMYDTLLWRSYIGMSPAEAGFDSAYQYFDKLMLSDGSYKAHPGYGLSNYTVDYEHWYVMYNSNDDATLTSDGWEKMLYDDAVAKQNSDGGLINYLSGMPVFMKYVSNTSGTLLSGQITSASSGVNGIRVSVVDDEGTVRATAYTDENGNYDVLVTGSNPKIKYYSGSQNLTDGTLIKSVDYTESMAGGFDIPTTTGAGTFVDSDDKDRSEMIFNAGATMSMEGKTTGRTYDNATAGGITLTASGFTWAGVVPDVYTVTLKSGDVSYVTNVTVTANPGPDTNAGIKVTVNVYKVTLTLVDDTGCTRGGGSVRFTDLVSGFTSDPVTIADGGIVETNLVPGTYILTNFSDPYVTASAPITVSSSEVTQTVKAFDATAITFNGFPAGFNNKMATVYNSGYQTAELISGEQVVFDLPNGLGPVKYTVYATDGTNAYMGLTNGTTTPITVVPATIKITGTMKNTSSEATSGTIVFYSDDGYQIPVSVASDGTYSVILKGGDYTVYAKSGSQVSISRLNVTADAENNIDLKDGKSISGKTYWISSSNQMPFIPLVVNNITGCDGCSLALVSDATGSYSFYIPSDATCNITATIVDPFYYGTAGTYTKTEEGVSGTANFTASLAKIKISNTTTHKLTVGGTTIDAGATDVEVTRTGPSMTITIDDDDEYATSTLTTSPSAPSITIDDTMFNDLFDASTKYFALKISGLDTTDDVKVKALDEGQKVDKTTSGSDRKYFLEKDKKFMVTITNSDSTKVMYYNTDPMTGLISLARSFSDAATVTGYVGIAKDGTMTLEYESKTYDFSITSGRYSILVPIDKNITLKPVVKDESADITYEYTVPAVPIAAGTLTAGQTYVNNMAVTSSTDAGTNDITGTITVNGMTDAAVAEVSFKVSFTDGRTTPEDTTFALSGGSGWLNVTFYTDDTYTTEISTMNLGAVLTKDIYGKGTVLRDKIGYADDSLTVTLTDINGEVACTASIKAGEGNWVNNEPTKESTKISTYTNSLGDSEYMYAIEIVNDDNYTKRFTFSEITGVDTDKWFITFVNGKDIASYDGPTPYVDVKGHTTATVYVKITSKLHSQDDTIVLPQEITYKVTVTSSVKTISDISTTTDGTVTIAGNVATVKSTSSDSTISVDSNGATGRDVIDNRSEMPAYVWVLIALIVAAVFLIIWAASKRGVFSRRK